METSQENMMYRIIAETDDYIAVDKFPGISFHSESGSAGIAAQLKQDLAVANLYPVHRLDKMTSGLLLFGKSLAWAQSINQQFRDRQVSKFYLALSARKPKKKQGLVRGDMEKSRRGCWKLLATKENPAVTQFFSHSAEPGLRLFLLRPLTGKTHQLRVAMKSLGAPIVGDQRYGGEDQDRGYLHAYGLQFQWQGESIRLVCAPTIGEMFTRSSVQQALLQYSDPWGIDWPKI
ncbi:MAG: TIGR01621 family pseudouridine synthase [Motiliproteus sp.]